MLQASIANDGGNPQILLAIPFTFQQTTVASLTRINFTFVLKSGLLQQPRFGSKQSTKHAMTEEAQRIERIISKHVHDVRNSIHCLHFEAVLLGELTTDPEVAGAVRRMSAELTQLEATVKALQYNFAEPAPLTLTSGDLLYLWQRQIASLETADRRIAWSPPPVARDMNLDAHAVLSIMRELILDAWWRAPASVLKAAVITTDHHVALELRESISSTPPAAVTLGEQQRLVATHGGTLEVCEDAPAGERTVTLTFPGLQPQAAE